MLCGRVGPLAALCNHPNGQKFPLEELCGDDDMWAVVFNLMDGLLCNTVAYRLPAESMWEDFLKAYLATLSCDIICG